KARRNPRGQVDAGTVTHVLGKREHPFDAIVNIDKIPHLVSAPPHRYWPFAVHRAFQYGRKRISHILILPIAREGPVTGYVVPMLLMSQQGEIFTCQLRPPRS